MPERVLVPGEPLPHRVVWQVDDGDPALHQRLLQQAANLLADLAAEGAEVEVVAHGGGLDLLMAGGAPAGAVRELQGRGVVFLACRNTLRSRGLEVGDLLEGVQAVPSGVGAVVRRQSQGWSYLRA